VSLIPLSDASRRPVHFPLASVCLVLANAVMFFVELAGASPS
jgi:hypothetical protein